MTASYQLGEELGRGALGRVVVVRGGETPLAGKILHASHRADERARARFAGEAAIASELNHPNIARVHGLEEIEGESVLLMELVDGESLATVIAQLAPLPEKRLLALASQLAAGLEAAHHAGLIHRDLKPDNVLVASAGEDDETIKLVDFGMARATSFAGVDQGAFAVVGTPDYMAPESVDPLAVDSRSDLYGLGCILFEMAMAAPPFTGATAFAVLEAHREKPLDTSTLEALCSPALRELIVSLLAKSPADRPQSAAQVCETLASITASDTALALVGGTTLSISGACAQCGSPSIAGVPVCFGCGLSQVRLEKGGHTVFVVGPGATTDKLDSRLRQKLVDWLLSNPALGIAPGRLEKKVPRLPFVIATAVSEASGFALGESLESLGFEVEVMRGGRLALREIRKKGLSLGGRFALIGVSGLAYGLHNVIGPLLIPIVGLGGLGAVAGGFFAATQAAADQSGKTTGPLPALLAEPLARVGAIIPGIEHTRHRESLRGVVQRALAVRVAGGERVDSEIDASLGELVDVASAAVARIDRIDSNLAAGDLRNATNDERKQMRERDALAARLLEITAFLDSMRARLIALAAGSGSRDALDDLRAHIEALEEIEAL